MKKLAALLLFALLTCILFASALAEAEKPFAGEEITIYNTYDYIDPEVIDLFQEETGITVYYATSFMNEDMYTRVATGAGKYDVIFPAEYMVERMRKENRLEELNLDNIPNIANVVDSMRNPSYDPQNAHSVPYMWGTLGILYNTDMVDEPITSWAALMDERYAGSIYMMDSVRDTIGLALKYLGYSFNSHNVDEIEEAGQWLLAQRKADLVAGYITEDQARDKMVANEAAMAVIYSGSALNAMDKNDKLEYVIPEEGGNLWVDNMCIPKGCEHKEAAECFINFMCRPDIAQMNMAYVRYSSPIRQVVENLTEEEKASSAMNPTEEELARCEFGADASDVAWKYDDVWMNLLM